MAETTLGINGLQPGFKYNVRVRGVFAGTPGPWSPTEEFDVFSDTSAGTGDKAPSPPSSFTISPTIDSFILKWNAPTTNADASVLKDMKEYVIEVRNGTYAGAASKVYTLPEVQKPSDLTNAVDRARTFEFTYKMNKDVFGGAGNPDPYFTIYSRDTTNNTSTVVNNHQGNAAPSAPTSLTATAVVGGVNLSWGGGTSNDITGYVLKYSESNGFNPVSSGTIVYQGPLTTAPFAGTVGTPYYFRVGSVDIFGQISWYATQATATPTGSTIDTTPPGVPQSPVTNVWEGTTYIINWTAPADADVVRYRIDIRNDGNTVTKTFYSEGTRFELSLANNIEAFGSAQLDPHFVRIWAIDAAGNISSTYLEIVAANTTAAPAHPGAPTVATPVLDAAGIYLSWSPVSDPDGIIDYYEIYGVTTSPTAVVWKGTGTSFKYPLTGAYSGVYYFRARTIDKFGRTGSYSSPQVSIDATTFLTAPTATGTAAFDTNDLSNRTAQITVSSITPPVSPYLNGVKIRYKKSSDTNYTEIDLGKSTAAYIIRGLAVGQAYNVEIASYDLQGRVGAWGNVTGTPFTQAPDTTVSAPTLVTLTTSVGAVSVGWTGVSDTDVINSMGRYDVEICDVNTFNNSTLQKQSIPGGPASSVMAASFTGLPPGSTRYARVRTYDAIGNPSPAWVTSTPASVVVASTVDTVAPAVPTAPANSWQGTSYIVTWTPPADSDVVRYKIEIRNDGNTATGTFYSTGPKFELTLEDNIKTFGTAQLDPTYVRIWSLDSWGNISATYAELNAAATVAAPAHPGHPTPTLKIDAAGIFVSWPISDPNNIIDYYEVYGTGTGSTNLLWKGAGSSFKYALPSAYSGLYYFRIQAKDKFGRPTTPAYGTEASINSATLLAAPTFSTASAFDTYDPTNKTAQITLSAITPPSSPELNGMKIRYKKSADTNYTEIDVAKETTTYIIRGLAVGIQYNISMASYDLQGRLSAWSTTSNVTQAADSSVNGATSRVLVANDKAVTVTWVGSSDTDVINGWGRYDVDIATDSGFTANVKRQTFPGGAAASIHSASFTGLTTVPYYARVITTDANGNATSGAGTLTSPASVTPTATTSDGAVPGTSPAATVTVPAAAQSLVINWPEIINNDVVTYDLYRHTSTPFTPPGTGTLVYSGAGTSYTDTGLTGGTTYYYRVIARDKDGASTVVGTQGSGVPKAYTSDGAAPSSSPAATVTIPAEAKALVIKWPEVANNDPVTYDLYRHTSTPFTPPGTGTLVYSGLGTAYTDRGLTGGTTYYYRIIARDKDGSAAVGTQGSGTPKSYSSDNVAPSSSPAATVTVPTASRSLVVTWPLISNADPVTYNLYRHTSSPFTPPGTGTLVYSGSGSSFTDTGLTGSTPYWYRVIASDADGSASAGVVGTGTAKSYQSDGIAPSSSPTPTIHGGVNYLAVSWDKVANADPLTYEVHISDVPGTPPFTPSAATLFAEVRGTLAYINKLADGSPLAYFEADGETKKLYYVRIIAKDDDGAAAAGTQVSASMAQVNTGDIAVNTITASQIYSDAMTTQNFSAVDSLIQSLVMGDLDSQHVEADADGLRVIDGNGNLLVDLPTDPTKRPKFNGDLIAQNLEVIGATILGTTTVGQGTSLELQATQAAPGSSPAVSIGYPDTITFGGSGATQKQWYTLGYNAAGGALQNTACFYTARPNGNGYWRYVEEYVASTGAFNRSIDLPNSTDDLWGMTTLGAYIYTLHRNNSDQFFLYKWNMGSLTLAGTLNVTANITSSKPGLGHDGTDIYIVVGSNQSSSANLRVLRYNTSLTLLNNVNHNALTFDTTETGGARTTEFSGLIKVGTTWYLSVYSYDGATTSRRRVYALTGTITTGNGLSRVTDDDFFGSGGAEADGIAYDGSSFYTIRDSAPLTKHTDWLWTSSDSSLYWVGFTWRDDTGTGEGTSAGQKHETTIGPRTSITARKRAGLKVTTTTIPGSGGADEPNAHRVYINRGASEPQASGRFDGRLQGTYTNETNIITSFATGGAQNPASGTFPGGVGAKIKSATVDAGVQGSSAAQGWSMDGSGAMQGLHPNIQIFQFTGTAGATGTTGFDPAANNQSDQQTTHTWYKPLNAGYTEVEIFCIGGGGGGGGGRRTSGTTASRGGGGGAGGGAIKVTMPIGALNATETVKVGGGGGGGGGRTINSDGINGGNGGDSTVSIGGVADLIKAGKGNGGTGGGQGTGGSGGSSTGGQSWQQQGGWGGVGGDALNSSSDNGGSVPNVLIAGTASLLRAGAPGGGGGGGYNGSSFSAGTGGNVYGTGGGTVGNNGGNGENYGSSAGANSRPLVGAGGGGSDGRGNVTAGDGGAGGLFGAGGGGGGAAASGSSAVSGNGGPGAPGIVVITCR